VKREYWGKKRGYVNVLRRKNGTLRLWEKAAKDRPIATFVERKNKEAILVTTKNISPESEYSRVNVIQISTKKPIPGKRGQVKATYKVYCGDNHKKGYILDGYSFLDVCSNRINFHNQLEDCKHSAICKAPCCFNSNTEGIDAELIEHSIRFIYSVEKRIKGDS
jgi:hypothetical protein